MSADQFWQFIERIDRAALAQGDEEGALNPLIEALSTQARETIEGFYEQLARSLHAIDGRRWADQAGPSGESDDGFLYARCYVVAMGRADYEEVLADPSRMSKSIEAWCEGLLYVSSQAYESAFGESFDPETSVSYETGSNKVQWPE